MKSKKRFFKKELEEVDAILPFMSLLIIIIPLLLSNLAFYHFKVIQTSFPGASNSSEDEPKKVKKTKMVMAKLLIEPKIIQLEILDESDGSTIKKERRKASIKNSQRMFSLLRKYRSRYKKLDTLLVSTHEKVRYDLLVNILHQFKKKIPFKKSRIKGKDFQFKIVILPAAKELTLPVES